MKKLLILALFILGFSQINYAQKIPKNALGLRLGDNDGFGGEISYQRGLSNKNRLEFDLGWRSGSVIDAVKVVGLYQWVWKIDGGFNWYAGIGAGLGSYSYNDNWKKGNPYYKYYSNYEDSGVYFLAAGNIGIEYDFDIPLQISLDVRPEIYFNGYGDNFGPDLALGIRYQF